ncbi:MAG: ATP-binding cassette domain-containing protein [Methanobacteriota archaeon]
MTGVIETRGLTKRYGDLTAVDALDLSIGKGEIFGLLGPNGAGKTTLISMLATILRPTSGSAAVAGHDVVRESPKVRRAIGIVFQEPTLDGILTGRENLELHARLYAVPRAERAARIRELLHLVDLEPRADDLARTYSGGMKRRLEIARGLLHRPQVLFLDEPTLGLDPQTRQHIWAYIGRMAKEAGTTIVLTTHYMDEADALCDRVGIIDHGKIVALDAPRRLKESLGGDIVRLSVPDAAAAKIEETLEVLPFVRKVEMKKDEPGPLTTIALTVDQASDHLSEILAAAAGAKGVEVRVPTLEDVFIHHTGREMRDSEETGDSFMDAFVKTQQGGR